MFSLGTIFALLSYFLWEWNNIVRSQKCLRLNFIKITTRYGEEIMTGLLSWTPSVTANVVSQHLTVVVNGVSVFDGDFADNTTSQYSFNCNAGDNVSATLTAFDGTLRSTPVTANGVVPTPPSPPEAPTNFVLTFQ